MAKSGEQIRAKVARAEVLEVRVLNAEVRQMWLTFNEVVRQAMHSEDKQEIETALDRIIDVSDEINDLVACNIDNGID